jgi:hypothetical protein
VAESDEHGRALRLDEQRARRRSIVATAAIAAVATVALAFVAVARLSGTPTGQPRVQVLGINATSTTGYVLPTEPPLASISTYPQTPTSATTAPATTTTLHAVAPTTIPKTTTTTTSTTVPATTTTGQPAAPIVFWGATPSSVTTQSGAIVTVSVHATNLGTAAGSVTVPGCASPPQPAVGGGSGVCTQGGQTVNIAVQQTWTWNVKFWALSDSTIAGAPLPPGTYTVAIGSATVKLHITP